jgi:hypothetical protein
MSRALQLYRLQQVDSQLDRARSRLAEITGELASNEPLRQAEAAAQAAEEILDHTRKALHTAEANTKSQRIKIEQAESALYGGRVQNPKELQDLQKDIASLKRFLETLEERQLEALLAYEEAETTCNAASAQLADTRAAALQTNAHLASEQTSLEAGMLRLASERTIIQIGIPADDRQRYETIRAKRRGIAVAEVGGDSCSACGSSLSSSLRQLARSASQLTQCDTCGRILYSA